jgi:hypothetical protein
MDFGNWIGGSASGALEQAAVGYLVVSLLAPLTWMLGVEVCRRFRTPASAARGQRPNSRLTRLSLSIARLKQSNTLWLAGGRERG